MAAINTRFAKQQRMVTWENLSSSSHGNCPPHGVVQVIGHTILTDGRVYLHGRRPIDTSGRYLLNSVLGVNSLTSGGSRGEATIDSPFLIAVEEPVFAGTLIGPVVDSWLAGAGTTWIALTDSKDDVALCIPNPDQTKIVLVTGPDGDDYEGNVTEWDGTQFKIKGACKIIDVSTETAVP